jgi:hypothetical protein
MRVLVHLIHGAHSCVWLALLRLLDKARGLFFNGQMKEILRTNDATTIPFACALLQGEGIETFVLDVHMSVLEGSVGVLPRRVMVQDDDFAAAVVVLNDNKIVTGL